MRDPRWVEVATTEGPLPFWRDERGNDWGLGQLHLSDSLEGPNAALVALVRGAGEVEQLRAELTVMRGLHAAVNALETVENDRLRVERDAAYAEVERLRARLVEALHAYNDGAWDDLERALGIHPVGSEGGPSVTVSELLEDDDAITRARQGQD